MLIGRWGKLIGIDRRLECDGAQSAEVVASGLNRWLDPEACARGHSKWCARSGSDRALLLNRPKRRQPLGAYCCGTCFGTT